MSFTRRVVLALLVAGVAPALVLGVFSFTAYRTELLEALGRSQQVLTSEGARAIERQVQREADAFQALVRAIPFSRLTKEELPAVLQIPARQTPGLTALAALDERGDAVAAPVVVSREGPPTDLDAWSSRIPLKAALASGAAVGAPYRAGDGPPRIAVALRVVEAPPLVVAAELTLDEAVASLGELAAGGDAAFLFGPSGEVVAQAGAARGDGRGELAFAKSGPPGRPPAPLALERDGQEWLAASAPLPALGWWLVVEKPGEAAFRPADRLRRFALGWAAAAVLVLAVLGTLLGRAFGRPIAELSRAAQALSGGDYARRVGVTRKDELGRFAAAFNTMAEEIQRRDREIRAWNEELQRRVDARTAELKAAQDQIARSRRLAGLAALSAGVSHELNNPVMGLLGFIDMTRQELPADAPQQELLGHARDAALRVSDIAERVRALVEQEKGEGVPVLLSDVVEAVLAPQRAALEGAGVRVRVDDAAAGARVMGRRSELEEVVRHLVRNAVAAMPKGGELHVGVSVVDQAVKLTVKDTGVGIPPEHHERIFDPFWTTKPTGRELGMGLTLVHRIVEGHGGRISVASAPGQGATFTVLLPGGEVGAHLQ